MTVARGFMIAVALASFADAAMAAAPSAAVIKQSTPMTSDELYRLYSQRSWIWKDGAGYFAVPQRRFSAWSGKGKAASYGVGKWFITGPGKVCFKADWHARNGVWPDVTCFSHRKKGSVIYQKREPKGDWYIFANAPVKKSDELTKLRRGDYVTPRLGKVEARLARKP